MGSIFGSVRVGSVWVELRLIEFRDVRQEDPTTSRRDPVGFKSWSQSRLSSVLERFCRGELLGRKVRRRKGLVGGSTTVKPEGF